jgi:hypothetical protein
MTLSPQSVSAISDLIENKLAIMSIDDRDDLREMVALKRALIELRGTPDDSIKNFGDIPRRGRRKKISDMLGESERASA